MSGCLICIIFPLHLIYPLKLKRMPNSHNFSVKMEYKKVKLLQQDTLLLEKLDHICSLLCFAVFSTFT